MSFSVEWSKAAAKQLLKIPKKQRLIILSWIQDYLDEFEHYCLWPCAKALQGSESGWRSPVLYVSYKIGDSRWATSTECRLLLFIFNQTPPRVKALPSHDAYCQYSYCCTPLRQAMC